MKLRSIVLRRWDELPNTAEIELESKDFHTQTLRFTPSNALFGRICEVVGEEMTEHMSSLFEDLTGSDSPDIPTKQTQKPFLETDDD